MLRYITIITIVLNLVSFTAFGIDKNKARVGQWRIPEATLMGFAVIGGSIGAFLGMKAFHHKTKKPLFYVGIPCIILIQAAACIYMAVHFVLN